MGQSHLFVVRIWRRLSAFRASVRRVNGDEPKVFDSATDMAHYLERASETNGGSGTTAPEDSEGPRNG